jgi:hypothetical protein
MPVSPTNILKVLRAAQQQLQAPINDAEAALARAEATRSKAQHDAVRATQHLAAIDRTESTIINPLRQQAQAAYDAARAHEQQTQAAVNAATAQLIDAYAHSARAAYQSYLAAMQSVDPSFTDPLAPDRPPQPESVTQPSLFPEKPPLRGAVN